MVVFFATQDLVEFHYHLFVKCLRDEEEEEEEDEDGDEWLFKLHGDMAQKV